jgi:hypothetical protein
MSGVHLPGEEVQYMRGAAGSGHAHCFLLFLLKVVRNP